MLKTRPKSLLLSAVLASTVCLTGAQATLGDRPTYAAARSAGAQVAQAQSSEQAAAAESVLPVQSSPAGATAKTTDKPVLTDTAKPTVGTSNQQTSREAERRLSALRADLNSYVLAALRSYQGKSYPYLLNSDYAHYNGVTSNIYYQDKLLLRAHPSGNRASYCVGITFEVFFKAMQSRNKVAGLSIASFNGMSYSDLQDFVLLWYAAAGPKAVSNPAYAMVKYGLGREITDWEQAKSGDFIDFSRSNGTGHSVVFLGWVRENGKIVGLHYWSSQGSTGGIGEKTEYFSPRGGVLTNEFYIGHVKAISAYR